MKIFKLKTLLQLLVLGSMYSLVNIIPFIQYVWYTPFQQLLGASNTQLGLLISIYGMGVIFMTPFGGFLCDKFDNKKLYIIYLLMYAIGTFVFTTFPSYPVALIVWAVYVAGAALMQYPTHLKMVRLLATEENQGKIYGLNETCIGLCNLAFNFIMMAIFARFADNVTGIKWAINSIAIICIVVAVIAWFVLDSTKEMMANSSEINDDDDQEKLDVLTVLKAPSTYLVAFTIFAVYTFLNTLSYLTPYFTDVLGVAVVFTGVIAILRQHGMTLLGAPIGGFVADLVKSPAKVLLGVYTVGIIGLVYLIFTKTTSVGVLIAIALLLSLAVYVARGSYYATMSELGIPQKHTASVIGIAAAIGFSPDLFQFALYGHWLDTVGNAAYPRMFIFQTCVLLAGACIAIAILVIKKKNLQKSK